MHWHGVILPNGMDGVVGLNQPQIEPGETFTYEFTLRQHGTQMYHPHFDEMVQMAMGMKGFFIIHPRQPLRRVDRDFAIFLQRMVRSSPAPATPDPTVMTRLQPLHLQQPGLPRHRAAASSRLGDRVRIRIANLSMDSHPIHIHGHTLPLTGTDGGPIAGVGVDGPRPPSTCRRARRATSSSSPTTPATGRCTATRPTTR